MDTYNNERYQRQVQLERVGETGQRKLAQARVLVVGAGGLSATLLPILAASGVGSIKIYDADVIELSNLHRQILFRMPDIGHYKAMTAQLHLQALNPDIRIEAYAESINKKNASEALQDVDVVVDAADRFQVTYLLSDICHQRQIPLVSASVLEEHGYVGAFCGQSAPSYRAIFPELPKHMQSCQSAGVLASTVATLASLQAHMVLNIILEQIPSALGQMLNLDLATWHMQSFRFDHAPEPEDQWLWLELDEINNEDYVIELRNDIEQPLPVYPTVQRHTLDALKNHPLQLRFDQRIVCICQSGVRAQQARLLLKQQGYTQVAICSS